MIDQPFLDLFSNIESREGLFLWLTMLLSFFMGLIVALLLRGAKIRRLKRELKVVQDKEKVAQAQLQSAQQQLQERNAELQEESQQRVALMDKVGHTERLVEDKNQALVQVNRQVEDLQSANRNYALSISDLNDEIITLKSQDNQSVSDTDSRSIDEHSEAVVSTTEYTQLQDRLSKLEQQLADLSSTTTTRTVTVPSPVVEEAVFEPEPQLHTEKTVLYDKIIVADREQDDLVQIDGIGGFNAKQLNNIGVFTFAEIAHWDDKRIEEVTEAIGFMSGRIEKDRWVEQAAVLAAAQENEAQAYEAVTEEVTETVVEEASSTGSEDDLKVIEGIGPKIETVLKEAGIMTWAKLASTGPGDLKDILEAAGGRFKMHNPYTWPLQARLAAGERWTELKEYQDELKGGKEKKS